jgi:hypothetical protein
VFKQKAEAVFGSSDIARFAEPERMDRLIRTYATRADLSVATPATAGSAALQLLQSGSGSSALLLSLLR